MSNNDKVIIDICTLVFSFIGFGISAYILFLIFSYRRQYPINSATFLLCNTYSIIIYTCINYIIMYSYILYGDVNKNISFNSWWCYAHAYFILVGLSAIYISYLLQSCLRFFRVVLHRWKQLRTLEMMAKFIIGQWVISFILLTFALIWHYIEYLPDTYHCQIALNNFLGNLLAIFIIFFVPTTVSMFIYIYIIYYTKQQTNLITTQQTRYRAIQRDIVVLRRVIILITSVMILSLPTVILWIYYLVTGFLLPLSYHVEWLLFSVSLVFLSSTSTFITPQVRRLIHLNWGLNQRVRPAIMNQTPELT